MPPVMNNTVAQIYEVVAQMYEIVAKQCFCLWELV